MQQDPILVAGAGPVGLTAAHRIARHGVPVRIIDMNDGPTDLSKALVVWRRTLQVLDSTIDHQRFMDVGHEVRQARFIASGKPLATIPFKDEEHLLPAGMFVPQSQTEQILIQALAEQSIEVERRTQLVDLTPDNEGVTCQLEGPDGNEQFRCSWLIGCDGAHSVARHKLNIKFPGDTVDHAWILGDVRVDIETSPHETIIESSPDGPVAFFPIGADRWRLIADAGPVKPETERRDPSEADLQAVLDERSSQGWKILETFWKAEFRVNERQVDQYVHGRVLLAGDAAHVHSPAGGQGMNTGIQDAANLAWKIALAWKGGPTSLVETYQDERHAIGRAVVKASGRMLRAAMIKNPVARHLRDFAAQIALSVPAVRHHMYEFLSEESVDVRGSSLCGPGIKGANVQPGDAFPDLDIGTPECPMPATDLLKQCEAVCVVFGSSSADLPARFGPTESGFPITVRNVGNGTDYPHVEQLARVFGLSSGGFVLVRPDGVVAAVATEADVVVDLLQGLF